jgi:hypothetical protein
VKPIGGQTGDGDGIGVAVFFTLFFLTGFFFGFLLVVTEGDVCTVEPDFEAAGVGEGLAVTDGFGVEVAAYELSEIKIIERIIEINNLNFIPCST